MTKQENKPQYFTVKLEVLAPVTLKYKILAKSPEEAIKKVESNLISNLTETPKPNLAKHKKLHANVYAAGYTRILLNKKY